MRRTSTACAAAAAGFAVFLAPLASRAGFLETLGNIGKAVVHGVQGVGSFVGGILGGVVGSPAGGIVEAIVSPAIQSFESSGHKLIEDLDSRIGAQIERTSRAGASLESQVNLHLAERVEQVNQDAAQRIAQIQLTGDELIDRALGQLDDLSRKRLAEAGKLVKSSVAQADQSIARRLDQVHAIARASIAQVDDAVAARIDQADEAVGKRIGNADVVLTKQGLNLEGSLLRVAALVATLGIIAFMIWRLWVEISAAIEKRSWWTYLGRWFAQALLAAAGAYGLFRLGQHIDVGPREKQLALVQLHESTLRASLASFDFSGV